MVMAIQFESMRYSILVMTCIPFSFIGAIPLLFVTHSKISITSLLGFLMLAGIVVNNGILMVDTTNENLKTMPMDEALVTAGKSRMRPILMTTLTTIMSMVPLCISRGGSEDAMKGMALVIIGGLTASTILTLFLLPTFYMLINRRKSYAIEVKVSEGNSGKDNMMALPMPGDNGQPPEDGASPANPNGEALEKPDGEPSEKPE